MGCPLLTYLAASGVGTIGIADPDRIEKINKLWEEGHTIIIETARGCGSKINHYEDTFNQLRSWGLKFTSLRTGVKFGGDFFIDDKGINSEDFF